MVVLATPPFWLATARTEASRTAWPPVQRQPLAAARRTRPGRWCCCPDRGRSCRCRGSRSSRSPADPARRPAPAAGPGSRRSWSWWSTSMPSSPCSAASAAQDLRAEEPPRAPDPRDGRSRPRRRPGAPGRCPARPRWRTAARAPARRRPGTGRTPRSGPRTWPALTMASAMCGRPTDGLLPTSASTCSSVTGTPSSASSAQHPGQPAHPTAADLGHLGGQSGRRRIGAVGQQVHAVALPGAGQLHPAHHLDAQPLAGAGGLVQPVEGVVVGQRHHVQPGVPGLDDQLGRRVGAVGDRGVGVQVDPHDLAGACHAARSDRGADRAGSSADDPQAHRDPGQVGPAAR